jgi:hypothetical protein
LTRIEKEGMMSKVKKMLYKYDHNDSIQWIGAGFIVTGHTLNAIGPSVYPYNILTFAVGTSLFLLWAFRVKNTPQTAVNTAVLAIGLVGLYKAFG